MRTIDETIARDIPLYIPDTGLEWLKLKVSRKSRTLYPHITKRPETIIPMT